MAQHGLGLAHRGGDRAVAQRLARLALEPVDLRRELRDHVVEPVQILLGGVEPQFCLVAARMQAGNAGGFLEHAPALLGLRLDDLADAALVHERRGARAGRGIREQDLHVARAHFAAIDPIGRAGVPLDPPRDFERVLLVELCRCGAVAIVEEQRHLAGIARRPAGAAGEDHVVHVGGPHGFVRGFAHDPAQRLDEVGFAAAVGSDDAGQSRLDRHVGRLDERLEPDQAQLAELHRPASIGSATARAMPARRRARQGRGPSASGIRG